MMTKYILLSKNHSYEVQRRTGGLFWKKGMSLHVDVFFTKENNVLQKFVYFTCMQRADQDSEDVPILKFCIWFQEHLQDVVWFLEQVSVFLIAPTIPTSHHTPFSVICFVTVEPEQTHSGSIITGFMSKKCLLFLPLASVKSSFSE